MPVNILPEAGAQIDDHETYIAEQGSPERAAELTARMLTRCHGIGEVPLGGRPRDELGQGLRSVPFEGGTATIFYRVTEHEVLIVAVLYRGRDQAAYFGNSG